MSDADTTRTTVKTFVPAYQKDEWKRHADDLGMSQSEFVRTMVQAGRRDFEFETSYQVVDNESHTSERHGDDETGTGETGANGELRDRILTILSTSNYLAWDELVDALTEDLEDRLEAAIQQLQRENRIQHSGRHGGYALVEDDGN